MIFESLFKTVRGIVKLRGGTTGTIIGNTGDALNVSTSTVGYLAGKKMYSTAATLNQASASLDNPLVLIKNPLGSTKIIYIYKVFMSVNVTNVSATFDIYANPTILTNGSALTIAPGFIGGSQPTAAALAYSLPTVSASGILMASVAQGQNTQAFSLGEYVIAIAANNSILLTGMPTSNNRECTTTVIWAEV